MPFERAFDGLMQRNPLTRFSAVAEHTIEQTHPEGTTHHAGESIRVLSWNIAKNNHSDRWKEEFLVLVERHKPDKIFLQEARLCAKTNAAFGLGESDLDELELEMGWSFAPNFIDAATDTYSGVLIATRVQSLGNRSLMSTHSEPITNTPKVTLFSRYSLADGSERSQTTDVESACSEDLLAVNTHLINFVSLAKFEAQLQAIEAVLQQHSGAIIFSGDFNTWNAGRWSKLTQMAARLQLSAVAFDAVNTQKLKSFLKSPPLDYIFYRGFSQKPLSACVIDTVTSSDHNPLVVELTRL